MSKQVAWTKFIYATFCEEAMLNETERFIMRTRIEGWPVTKQAMHLNMSEANVHRMIRVLKVKYDKVAANNPKLPPRRHSAKETTVQLKSIVYRVTLSSTGL